MRIGSAPQRGAAQGRGRPARVATGVDGSGRNIRGYQRTAVRLIGTRRDASESRPGQSSSARSSIATLANPGESTFVKVVAIHAAKTHLSHLMEEVAGGEQVVIVRGKAPVARLVPIGPQKKGRVFGAMRGRARVDRRFFAPLPDEEIEAWGR